MDHFNVSRDKNRTRREVLDQRRTHAETRRTLTVVQPSGTQERLEGIFRAAPIGMGLLRNRIFIEFNDRFCEMVGYDRDELIGRSSRILYVTQEDYDYVGTVKYEQIVRTGTGTVETRWKRKDGRVIDILLSSSAIDRTDLSRGVTFTATDITARNETQARLRQSELLLREAEAIAHVGSVRRDLRTQAITWSDETYRIYGYTPGEICPSPELILSHIHPEDRERFANIAGLSGGLARLEEVTYRLIRRDGQVRTVHARATVERDHTGTPVRLIAAVQDITDRTRAEQALCESEDKFKTLADESFDGIVVHDGVEVIEVNKTFCRVWGYEPQEAVGQKIDRFLTPDSLAAIRHNLERNCDGAYELVALRKDGTTFPAEISGKPITYRGRRVRIATIRDITDRKQAYEALRESEGRYRGLVEGSLLGIGISKDNRILYANRSLLRMYGYDDFREFAARSLLDYLTPQSRTEVEQWRQRRDRGEDAPDVFEHDIIRKDGTLRTLQLCISHVTIGDTMCSQTAFIDITERKQAVSRLRDNEEQYRLLVEHSPDAICIQCDEEIRFANRAALRLLGASRYDQIVGRNGLDFVHPDDRRLAEARMATLREERVAVPRREMKYVRLDGHFVDVEVTGVPTTFQGKPAAQFIVHDISERKQAEKSLAESEDKFKILADESFDSIIIHDGLQVISVNQTFCRTWGYEADEVPGSQIARYVAPESLSVVRKYASSGFDKVYEIVAVRKDGTKFAAEVAGKLLVYKGRTVRIATVRDISATRHTEEALRASEERFRGVFQHAPLGIAIGMDGAAIAVNPAFAKIVGYEADELVGRKFHDYTPPDDCAREREFIQDILSGRREGATMQKRFIHKDGRIVWANVTMTTMRNPLGKVEAMVEIVEDITERKAAEEALAAASRQWQSTFDSVSDVIWVLDNDFRIRRSNRAVERLFHKTPEEVVGKHCWEIVHGTTEPIPLCPIHRLRQTLSRQTIELRIDPCWYEVAVDPIVDAAGQLDGIVHIISDITRHKKTEENLLTQRKKLRSLASELSLAEERERRRIAANLHDHACQSLALAKMQLQSALDAARPAKTLLRPICANLDETIDSLRELTFDLSSATLYKFGLEAALEELLKDEFPGEKPTTRQFLTDGKPKPLSPDIGVLLYQSVRELLINVAKHAHAAHVTAEVQRENDCIRILVADDGVGFDAETVLSSAYRNRSVGLFFVRERLDYIGGALTVDSHPGRGSRFTLIAPLEKPCPVVKETDDGNEDPTG